MPSISRRWQVGIVFVAGCAALAWAGAGRGGPEKAASAGRGGAKRESELFYYPAEKGCASRCHEAGARKGEVLVCRLNEYPQWQKQDKHELAHKVLTEERGKAMQKALGYADVATDARCLSCHGVVRGDAPPYNKDDFKPEDEGVTCSVCHGPSKKWYAPHALYGEKEKWRDLCRECKDSEYGMTDLWDPVKRAALCASCHIGNAEQGKVVTHEMYAAGHPPLPGFEVATFSNQMPRHWQYQREKPAEVQKLLGFDGKEYEEAKMVLVGAAVSLRESMRLLAAEAAACAKKDPKKDALDLAHFDCYACHHDLKSPSRRPGPGPGRKPGRVPMRLWPTALMPLVIRHAAKDAAAAEKLGEEYAGLLDKVEKGFDARPFGDPAKIAPAAKALAEWADQRAADLNKKPCHEADVRKALARLPALYKDARLDYDSARQVAWAFKTMREEHSYITDAECDPEVDCALADLDKLLKFELVRRKSPPGKDARKPRIADEVSENLKVLYAYELDPFQRLMGKLAGRGDKKK